MYDVVLIYREQEIQTIRGERAWRQIVAVEVDGHVFDMIPEGSDILIGQEAGMGAAEVTFTVLASTVGYRPQDPIETNPEISARIREGLADKETIEVDRSAHRASQTTMDLSNDRPEEAIPEVVERLAVSYEEHIGVPPTHIIPPGQTEPVPLADWLARQRVSSSVPDSTTDGGDHGQRG